MLSVENKSFMLSIIMLNVVMLSAIMPSVGATIYKTRVEATNALANNITVIITIVKSFTVQALSEN
jgi:hypothetical protein